ncbi:P63C domain-containing protein [Synechococcus elongatus IITB7]|uniref:P63C domain-containing protein n=1 Tax=Synechococcus elongatus TaxID=32046 RepID=UPI0030CADE05
MSDEPVLPEVVTAVEDYPVFEATHRGYLTIAGAKIPCAVLKNGKRVISQTGLFQAFERPRKGEKRQKELPSIIGAANLLPYVTEELREKSKAIHYFHSNGTIASGYDAEFIPLICALYLDAGKADPAVLVTSQIKLVERSEILLRALAKVGITGLIDEATGYQYDREKDALQALLSKYIAEEFLPWTSRFPREFYQEIFRLYGYRYDPLSLKRPQFIGRFTRDFVYNQMSPDVLKELEVRNPTLENGRRRRKHHQHLTEDIGVPHLKSHLTKLITVMQLSDSIDDFKENFKRVFKKTDQLQFNLNQTE